MSPDNATIQETYIEVGDGHKLYAQDWGYKKAKTPIIFLHGGPGSGCNDKHRELFDASRQRVIFFDQRGAGKSLPKGSLEANDTEHLIEDVSKVADYFGVRKFVLVGGSWGSCLALAYGLKHPERVAGMVMRGIFTGSQNEIDFLDKGGFRNFFPEVWEAHLARTPKKYHNDPGAYHMPRIFGNDEQARKESAYAYSEMEGALLKLDDRHETESFDEFDPSSTIIEVHFLTNRCFMPDNYIFENAHKLKMPIWMVQGRYDAVCPPEAAYKLNKSLENGHIIWTIAGHSGSDRANYESMRVLLMQWVD